MVDHFKFIEAKQEDFPKIALFLAENSGNLCLPAAVRKEEDCLKADVDVIQKGEKRILLAFLENSESLKGVFILRNKNKDLQIERAVATNIKSGKGFSLEEEFTNWIKKHVYWNQKTVCGERLRRGQKLNLENLLQKSNHPRC